MYRKILSFIYYKNKFLILKTNPSPIHGDSKWYVVTGGSNKYERLNKTVIREIKEETNLDVLKIISLNEFYIYKDYKNRTCKEYAFLSVVSNNKIILNEEHLTYKWVDFNNFFNLLNWEGDKVLLKKKILQIVKVLNN
jgi:8-oxo-dGTP pyrophosphatase MutT (NUDIX family)